LWRHICLCGSDQTETGILECDDELLMFLDYRMATPRITETELLKLDAS
jgi:hypothetical protein